MTETPEREPPQPKVGAKKGVTINIMFPCESDDFAIKVKKAIDDVVKDIPEKRYTFSITEV